MRVGSGSVAGVLLAMVTLASAPVVLAQELPTERVPTRWSLSGGVVVAQPVGEFSEYVGTGFGAAMQALFRIDPSGILSLRGDIGFVNYGNETRRVCFSQTVGCRVQLDLTTSNNIALVGFGPHIELPTPYARPYVHAGIGAAYFGTTSSVRGTNRSDDFASSTNFDDLTFSWLAGTGLNIPITRTATPVSVQLGVRYHGNGNAEYLRRGDISDHPDGSITMNPTRSEANLITYQIGISAVLGRPRPN
jgi:opacity protein-like surface antigen